MIECMSRSKLTLVSSGILYYSIRPKRWCFFYPTRDRRKNFSPGQTGVKSVSVYPYSLDQVVFYFGSFVVHTKLNTKGMFRTWSNIYDGTLFVEIVTDFQLLTVFAIKTFKRFLAGFLNALLDMFSKTLYKLLWHLLVSFFIVELFNHCNVFFWGFSFHFCLLF